MGGCCSCARMRPSCSKRWLAWVPCRRPCISLMAAWPSGGCGRPGQEVAQANRVVAFEQAMEALRRGKHAEAQAIIKAGLALGEFAEVIKTLRAGRPSA